MHVQVTHTLRLANLFHFDEIQFLSNNCCEYSMLFSLSISHHDFLHQVIQYYGIYNYNHLAIL